MKTTSLVLAVLFCFPILSSFAQADVKLAVVDMSKVMKDYNRSIAAERDLKAKAQKAQEDIQNMMGTYTKMRDEVLKLEQDIKAPGLSEQLKKAKMDEFGKKYQALRTYENQVREQQQGRENLFRQETLKVRSDIITDINKVVVQVSSRERLGIVLDKSSMAMSGTTVLLYTDASVRDISDDVLRVLNSAAPGTTGTAPAPAPAGTAPRPAAPRPQPVR